MSVRLWFVNVRFFSAASTNWSKTKAGYFSSTAKFYPNLHLKLNTNDHLLP